MKTLLLLAGIFLLSSNYLGDKFTNLASLISNANAGTGEVRVSPKRNVSWDVLFNVDATNSITAKRDITVDRDCLMFRDGFIIYAGEKIIRHHVASGGINNSMWLLQDNPLEKINFTMHESGDNGMVIIESCVLIP